MTEIKHFGIPGMHWGIRKRGPASEDHTQARELKKKHVSELSNKEIQTIVTRKQLEKQLKSLDSGQSKLGQKILAGILNKWGPVLVNSFIKRRTGVNMNDPFNPESYSEGNVVDLKFLKD